MKKNTKAALVLLILAVILIALFYQGGRPMKIVAITQCWVEQTGHIEGGYWLNSSWRILAINDITGGSVSLLKFNRTLVDQWGANWCLENNIEPTARIDITLTPLQPYWTLPTVLRPYRVYPTVYATYWDFVNDRAIKDTGVSIPPLDTSCYVFSPEDPGSWETHTPFLVEVNKINGSNPFIWNNNGEAIDTGGGTGIVVAENPNDAAEILRIYDLGTLHTDYSAGPPFTHVVVFDEANAFTYNPNLIRDMQYDTDTSTGEWLNDHSYSAYWFGGGSYYTEPPGWHETGNRIARWDDDGSPAHYITPWLSPMDPLASEAWWPGITEDYKDGLYQRDNPVAADLFSDNPDTWSGEHEGIGRSLVNYLSDIRSYQRQLLDTWGQGVSIESDGRLKVNMPYGAASSVILIEVSTELADAIVIQEKVTNPQIINCVWESNQDTFSEISNYDVAEVRVRQDEPDITGAVFVRAKLSPIDIPALLDYTQLQRQMAYGDTYDFRFTLTNNNPGSATMHGTITFEAFNINGEITSTAALTFSLPPKGPVTRLTVFTVDRDEPSRKLSGVPITIEYGLDTDFAYTDEGSATFDLDTYQGNVLVYANETELYEGMTATPYVQSGPNTVTLELKRKGADDDETNWVLIAMVVLAVALASAIAYGIYKSKKSPKSAATKKRRGERAGVIYI